MKNKLKNENGKKQQEKIKNYKKSLIKYLKRFNRYHQ
jgi:hypothetical protein